MSKAQEQEDLSTLARQYAPRAIDTLVAILEPDSLAEDRDRIRAAEAILDRGYGKPSQAIIQIPANRRQAALLASMSDEALVAVIEQKQLPKLGGGQDMVTVPASRPSDQEPPRSSHGPADLYGDESDPLLL